MSDRAGRPVSSWPASLLPTLALLALISSGIAAEAASTASPRPAVESPVVEMTVAVEP